MLGHVYPPPWAGSALFLTSPGGQAGSMPFVSKVTGVNLMGLAATAITGGRIEDGRLAKKAAKIKIKTTNADGLQP